MQTTGLREVGVLGLGLVLALLVLLVLVLVVVVEATRRFGVCQL